MTFHQIKSSDMRPPPGSSRQKKIKRRHIKRFCFRRTLVFHSLNNAIIKRVTTHLRSLITPRLHINKKKMSVYVLICHSLTFAVVHTCLCCLPSFVLGGSPSVTNHDINASLPCIVWSIMLCRIGSSLCAQ